MILSTHNHSSTTNAGFSLVELIVSLALFSVVLTISVGALLMLVAANSQLQNEQSVMTNLSLAIDSMTREMRTGTDYFCASQPNDTSGPPDERLFADGANLNGLVNVRQDCPSGIGNSGHRLQGVAFVEAGGSVTGGDSDTRIVYFFDRDTQALYRRIDGGNAQSITSSNTIIEHAEFFVTGSEPLSTGNSNDDQASITIQITARSADDPAGKEYHMQTTISQRTLDI